jgi:hypothetical protein
MPLTSCGSGRRGRTYRAALRLFAVTAVLLAAAAPALAQTATDALPVLYRLDKGTGYEQGCFPPCLCPVVFNETVKGTLVLTPAGVDPLFTNYTVTGINWMVTLGGTDTFVTGSGTYRIGGEFALQQELTLDLKVGDNKVERFTSGLVTGPAPFPAIAITISMNNQTCYDTVFRIQASPVPRDQVVPYSLGGKSTFQRGCFGICDCLVGPVLPIKGNFALVTLAAEAPSRQYAVVDVAWLVPRNSRTASTAAAIPIRGAGFYTLGGEVALQQRLTLLLSVGTEAPARFDSGWIPGGDGFPRIDALVSQNALRCFDTVIDVHAEPRPTLIRRPPFPDATTP